MHGSPSPLSTDLALKSEEQALTPAEFRMLERMSATTYHKLKRAGLGPAEVRVPGTNFIRITATARKEWHASLERLRDSEASKLEQSRRSEAARRAGRKAAQSPNHVSNRKTRGL